MKLAKHLPAPFYTAIGAGNPNVPAEFECALAGRGFFLDWTQFDRDTLELLRPASDQSVEPGEQSRSNEGFWSRSAMDWSYGAGQVFFDRKDSDRRRFFASKGIDPWTIGKLTLHKDVDQVDAATDTNLKFCVAGSYIYKVEGATVAYSTTGAAGSWTANTFTGMGASVKAIATDGVNVYVGDGSNVWKVAIGTTGFGAAWSTFDATGLWYCNGRLIAANNNILVELAADGTTTTTIKTSIAGFVWMAVSGGPAAIFATQTAGNVSEVYYITVDSSTGALTAPAIATPWIRGETINTIRLYGGQVFFGTSRGVRVGTVGSSVASYGANFISFGQLIPISGGVTAFDFEGTDQGQFAWFTWTNYDGTSTGLGRLNLGHLVDVNLLTYAYASDLMVTGQGASQDVARFGSKTYVAVSGLGFYRESADRVASGTIDSGWVTHNDVEDKIAVGANVRHEPLNGSVSFSLTLTDSTVISCGTSATMSSLKPVSPFGAEQTLAERVGVRLTLTRSVTDTTAAPVTLVWQLFSLPTGNRNDEIILPLMVEDLVQGAHYDPAETFSWLKTLEADRRPVVFQIGTASYQVIVDRVRQAKPSGLVTVGSNTGPQGVFLVRLLTVELS